MVTYHSNEIVRVTAALEKASTMKDGSVRLVFDTSEIESEQMANLFALRNQYGHLIFAPNKTEEVFIPDEAAKEFRSDKTPSQRLRNVLYREWEQTRADVDFFSYYKSRMEEFIDLVKQKLDAKF